MPPKKKNRDIAEFEKLMEKYRSPVTLTKDELKRALMFLDNLDNLHLNCARCGELALLNSRLCLKHLRENLEYMLELEYFLQNKARQKKGGSVE